MSKDLVKKRRRQHAGFAHNRAIACIALLLILIGVGVLFYRYHQTPAHFPRVMAFQAKWSAWLEERKNHLQQHIDRQNKIASAALPLIKDNAPKQVHFEFYSMLQNNAVSVDAPQVMPTVPVATPSAVVASPEKKEVAAKPDVSSAKVKLASSVILPQDLEQAFSQELNTKRYVIQVGVFHSEVLAERYKRTLAAKGIKTTVVARAKTFRVELGPFNNKTQIKTANRDLAKQGLSGVVRVQHDL